MKSVSLFLLLLILSKQSLCWGFYGHRQINYYAVFLLPPEMIGFFKKNVYFLREHSVDPDKRRYAVSVEGPRHYIDIDHYGQFPYDSLPRKWTEAVERYSEDTLMKYGVGPWWIQTMLFRLTNAFAQRNNDRILRLSAEIGHYLGDVHVPLHASSNHNGQHSGQHGIHGFWESRLPELFAEKNWDFYIGHAEYVSNPLDFTWERVLESAAAVDTVLSFERKLHQSFAPDQKYAHEERNGILVRQYSRAYSQAYDKMMNGMVERRMRQSIFAVACFWYTAWVNAGQPDLNKIEPGFDTSKAFPEIEELSGLWRTQKTEARKACDE